MNRYMSELAQMIPACNAVPRKLDKLSILKMAVDHMKNLRGAVFDYTKKNRSTIDYTCTIYTCSV